MLYISCALTEHSHSLSPSRSLLCIYAEERDNKFLLPGFNPVTFYFSLSFPLSFSLFSAQSYNEPLFFPAVYIVTSVAVLEDRTSTNDGLRRWGSRIACGSVRQDDLVYAQRQTNIQMCRLRRLFLRRFDLCRRQQRFIPLDDTEFRQPITSKFWASSLIDLDRYWCLLGETICQPMVVDVGSDDLCAVRVSLLGSTGKESLSKSTWACLDRFNHGNIQRHREKQPSCLLFCI